MAAEAPRFITAFLDGVPIARVRVGAASWSPAVDVWETATEIVVVAELAGVDEKSLAVHFEGRELVIEGNRPERSHGAHQPIRQHQMELGYGRFERVIPIPVAVDGERIDATQRNGLLEIRCPKLNRPGKVRVAVTSSSDSSEP